MEDLSQDWQRVVIKVGSSLIAPDGTRCSTQYLLSLADYIHHCKQQGKQVVLVSSGSVAAGAGLTNSSRAQKLSIPEKQALAAIGQSQVMQHWQKLFDDTCAQILLTRSDLESEKRLVNARNTLEYLFKLGAIPIINENDSVVVDELVVGDNDNLAARVAITCNAERLIICSDVDGLYDKSPAKYPEAKLFKSIEAIDAQVMDFAGDSDSLIGTGGMKTKLEAASIAVEQGVETLIVNGRKGKTFESLKVNKNPGTLFLVSKG